MATAMVRARSAAEIPVVAAKVLELRSEKNYSQALLEISRLRKPVDVFFDKVMVMDKDPRVRANRIGFLGKLHGTMNRIADLSKLAT